MAHLAQEGGMTHAPRQQRPARGCGKPAAAACLVCGHAALALGVPILIVGAQFAVGRYLDVELALQLPRLPPNERVRVSGTMSDRAASHVVQEPEHA